MCPVQAGEHGCCISRQPCPLDFHWYKVDQVQQYCTCLADGNHGVARLLCSFGMNLDVSRTPEEVRFSFQFQDLLSEREMIESGRLLLPF